MQAKQIIAICISALAATGFAIQIDQGAWKSYILTLDGDDDHRATSALEDLKSRLIEFGGSITHEYTLIKGFTIDLPEQSIPQIQNILDKAYEKYGYDCRLEPDVKVHSPAFEHDVLEFGI